MTTANNEIVIINSGKTITLDEPIKRGDTLITEITLRKPKAGELRRSSGPARPATRLS